MNKIKGFTLIELLVVIAIIALLLSILVPAMNSVKELGKRLVCSNTLKTMCLANIIYTNEQNNAYLPIVYRTDEDKNGDGIVPEDVNWVSNEVFRAYTAFDQYETSSDYTMAKQFRCPSDIIAKDPKNAYMGVVLISYGYNFTDWGWGNSEYAGHKADELKRPGEKLAFIDAIDFWVDWPAADYKIGWDIVGQANVATYKEDYGLHGPTIYRHSDGANIGFYDGHVEYLKKQEIFIEDDYNANPKRPGMWVGNTAEYFRPARGRE